MSTYTRDQLVDEVLRKLMVVGAGQSPDTEDQELVDGKVDSLIDQLSADGVVQITDDDAIPGEFFDPVASLLANLCGPDFGKTFSPDVVAYYEQRMKKTLMVGPTYQPIETDHF